MSTTVDAMRVEQLRKELADAEAAQQVKNTLASELAEAEAALNEAQRLVTISKARLAEELAVLEGLSKEGASIPQGLSGMRVNHDLKSQRVNQSVHELTVERDKLAGELSKKQCALSQIVKRISEHAEYRAVREKQRRLVAEATELASTLFDVPLAHLNSVLRKISLLSETENGLISGARSALRDAGLPDIKPLLARFIQQITPQQLIDAVPYARTQARTAIDQVTESAARDVLR
jgi:hypothetical protein